MNRLASESSLYLRQHKGNPVDWFPWGPEALAKAKELDRPIFLSVGYSACHWCHVMEHESFEDEATAKALNDHFVSIKVDREERPDLDQIYMTAHHLLNRGEGGGWPLSVFLTPELTPFYAGTYFPPKDMYGRPSFKRLLASVVEAWKDKREQLGEVGKQVAEALQATGNPEPGDGALTPAILDNAAKVLRRSFDPTHGGFGSAPKFPHPLELRVLLRANARFGDGSALHAARLTLDKMARGGMYDQIGGGFARYSVDERWLVPHFEKMLYDNALLPPGYVEAFQQTGDPFYEQIARETLDYVLREMTSPAGGFYSTLDADSEGEEGKFYVWSLKEVEAILGDELAELATRVYGITSDGNFEGHNILFRSKTDEQDAKLNNLSLPAFRQKLAAIKAKLYAERAKRVWPGRDEKILTAWNALMISAFARAGAILSEPKYVAAAVTAAEYVLTKLRSADGRLYRTCGVDSPAKLAGYLEDYAYLADALVTLYEATFELRWLDTAAELCDTMLEHFADPVGGFFFTADDHEELIARTKDLQDGATPSGNAVAATALLRLSKLISADDYREAAFRTLTVYRNLMADSPSAAGQLLIALDLYLGPTREIAVIGKANDPDTVRVLMFLRAKFRPNQVIAFHDPTAGASEMALLRDRPMIDDTVTVYVCENFVCTTPLVGVAAIEQQFA
ncbi:thioredoxin domain-containing protein [Limnoglobus roseus]|uniref:Thioredoxin domain-containing protein n=1 Tax=Limnoglobus roseus TaxID=2598579 RepID=A0A5C1ACT0_9BACT|nr:thioredoxin domain-containing protein [Limnoglobus roseus]QEL15957.1 thioredoxin domain-containing protein [Limnoglobus roseus]